MCHIIIARSARNDYQFVTEEEVGMLVDSCPPHSHTPTLPRDSPSIVSPTHRKRVLILLLSHITIMILTYYYVQYG